VYKEGRTQSHVPGRTSYIILYVTLFSVGLNDKKKLTNHHQYVKLNMICIKWHKKINKNLKT